MKDHLNRHHPIINISINSALLMLILVVFLIVTLIKDVQSVSASVIVDQFVSDAISEAIILQWRTLTEIDNVGFYIQRSEQVSGPFSRVSPYITTDAEGGQGAEYFWFDEDVQADVVYYYRLEAIDVNGVSEYIGPITGTLSESLITSTPPSPTHTGIAGLGTATRTLTQQAPPMTATQTPTIRPVQGGPTATQIMNTPTVSNFLTETLTNTLSVTPQATSAFEPLPTIELLFPATDTPQIMQENRVQSPPSTPLTSSTTAMTLKESGGAILVRYRVLFVLIGALWICLGLLFIFLIRKFSS
jgi:hypothetical protein